MADGSNLVPDLKKRIEIMADHISRNGADFENTVKAKNANNPQFGFLYTGEGSEYYQQVLARLRAPQAPKSFPTLPAPARPPAPPQAPAQAPASQSSLAGLLRGGQVEGAPPVALADLLRRWKEPSVLPLTAEVERQLMGVVASVQQMASRDAIKSGRLWIECNTALAPHVAGNIMKHVVHLQSSSHRLHVLYLVHDVLQTEAARKEAHQPLIRAFKPFLPWILRPCYQLAMRGAAEETSRVLRLLQLWVDRSIITSQEADELKTIATATELPGIAPIPAVVPPPPPAAPANTLSSMVNAVASGMASGFTQSPSMMPGIRPGMPSMVSTLGSAPGVPGLRPPMPVMPGMPQAHGYQRQVISGRNAGPQTPETVPVGVMASMLAQATKQASSEKLVRYKPLDTAATPQILPAMEIPTPRLLGRVEEFYDELKDEERGSSSSRSRSSSSHSRSRSRSRDAPASGFSGFSGFSSAGMNAVPPPVF